MKKQKQPTQIGKKWSFSIAFIFVLWISFAFTSREAMRNDLNTITLDACSITNTTFQNTEEVTYKLYYNWNFVWISAGEVVFKVKELDNQYHLSAFGRTYKSYEWFFRVRDYYDSYVDKQTLLPTLSIRDITEGGYTLYDKVTFDQVKHTANSKRGRTAATIKENNTFEVEECMHDLLSIMYHVRNIDYDNYQAGDKLPIKIFMDKAVWPLNIHYKGKKENKKIKGLGKFNTIKVSPEVIAGEVFKEDTHMNIWIGDDDNKLPLLIESPLSVGSVKAVLKDYKGLKHKMEAKTD